MARKKRAAVGLGLQKLVVSPMNSNQRKAFLSDKNLVLSGVAGTGKTFIALNLALDDLMEGAVERIIIIRSTVPTRNFGFLPGNEAEKCSPYEEPYRAIANELFGRGDAYEILKGRGFIEFVSTSFLRGTTMAKTAVIIDEAQNMTFHELDTIATRIGQDSVIFVCGDYKQADLPVNGLKQFLAILGRMHGFDYIQFGVDDIVRSGFVADYIRTKESLGI